MNKKKEIGRALILTVMVLITILSGTWKYTAMPGMQKTYCLEETNLPTGEEVLQLINKQRNVAGLPPFFWSTRLAVDAEVRAEEASRLFSHSRPDGQDWYEADRHYMYAENLAKMFTNKHELVHAWLVTPEHFRNLTGPFKYAGIACHVGNDGVCCWAMEMGY